MFIGFAIIVVVCFISFGGTGYLQNHLPTNHLKITGDASPTFLIVWFLIALWTFADPGFHQRSYAAKSGNVAQKGILISIIFWAFFDFLTTSTGLYSKAVLPNLDQPILAFPLLAERILSSGWKGIFYAAMLATIISTLNSFLFLSATTISRDFIFRINKYSKDINLKKYTVWGIVISGLLSIVIAYFIPSVVEIWYTIGSMFIPGIILSVISAYYEKFRVSKEIIIIEMSGAVILSIIWFLIRSNFINSVIGEVEPMLVGLTFAILTHFVGLFRKSFLFDKRKNY
jgi:SSS family solute:Na+ symporter